MPVEIRHVEYALAITSGMSIRKAAEKLYVSEATMSIQLRALEAVLGIALFDRTGRGMWPTDEGRELITDFQRLIAARDTIVQTAQRLKESNLEAAQFVPTAGHLLCPHCGTPVTASNGCVTQMAGQCWDAMAAEKWQCGKCHRRFALPSNPFKAIEQRLHTESEKQP